MGRRPTPHPLFKKSWAKIIKPRKCAVFYVFVELFLKSSWGFGGNAPENSKWIPKQHGALSCENPASPLQLSVKHTSIFGRNMQNENLLYNYPDLLS